AEALDQPGGFDAITARAMATLADLLAAGAHLLRPGGRLLAMKGALPEAEIAALPDGWRVAAVHRLAVPGLDAERHLVVVGRSGGLTRPGAARAPGRAAGVMHNHRSGRRPRARADSLVPRLRTPWPASSPSPTRRAASERRRRR